MFCDGPGLTEPKGECDAGFYCKNGAYSSVSIAAKEDLVPTPRYDVYLFTDVH